jgi:hypothetical protein
MKKLLLLALLVSISCSKGDEPELEQDYTSFIISGIINDSFIDSKIGYYDEAGKSTLLMDLGDLKPFVDSQEFIMPEYHDVVYLFSGGILRLEKPFLLKKNKKNIFVLSPDERAIDASENYPH